MLGTQNILGTPREPFSRLLQKVIVFVKLFCANMIEEMREEYTSLFIFCVWMDKPIAYVPSYEKIRIKTS